MGLIFLMQVPRAGVHDVGLELLLFRGDSAFMIPPFCLWVATLGMGFPGGSEVKVSACNVGALGSTPVSRRSLEKETATHSSILAWRHPWTKEPGELQSMGEE